MLIEEINNTVGEFKPNPEYWPQYYTQPVCNYAWNVAPNVTKFKGSLKHLTALPKNAQVGDAYYIEKDSILVVRVINGWHHFD